MMYALVTVPFLLCAVIAVIVAGVRRGGSRRRLMLSGAVALVLCILTAIFDNLMIAAGLFTYSEELISGIRLGVAPVEDFAYPIAVAFLLPAIDALLPRSRGAGHAAQETGP